MGVNKNMKKFKTYTKTRKQLSQIICDICNKHVTQKCYSIEKGNITLLIEEDARWDNGKFYTIDLCEECFYKIKILIEKSFNIKFRNGTMSEYYQTEEESY